MITKGEITIICLIDWLMQCRFAAICYLNISRNPNKATWRISVKKQRILNQHCWFNANDFRFVLTMNSLCIFCRTKQYISVPSKREERKKIVDWRIFDWEYKEGPQNVIGLLHIKKDLHVLNTFSKWASLATLNRVFETALLEIRQYLKFVIKQKRINIIMGSVINKQNSARVFFLWFFSYFIRLVCMCLTCMQSSERDRNFAFTPFLDAWYLVSCW